MAQDRKDEVTEERNLYRQLSEDNRNLYREEGAKAREAHKEDVQLITQSLGAHVDEISDTIKGEIRECQHLHKKYHEPDQGG